MRLMELAQNHYIFQLINNEAQFHLNGYVNKKIIGVSHENSETAHKWPSHRL
jgi:hypothetical protein